MELQSKYRQAIDKFYHEYREGESKDISKLEFAGEYIFGFTTYDSEINELFAFRMIEVLNVIINKTWSEYIFKRENYINFLTMVNTPFLSDKLDWGTSIRSAWLSLDKEWYVFHCELLIGPGQDEIAAFVAALIDWVTMKE